MKDEKLIQRFLHKYDTAAADELINRYYDEIYRYAYRQSAGYADPKYTAQDMTQEIFISALRSLSTFNRQKAGFRTWLYQVANSRIIDFRRKFCRDEVQIDETSICSETDETDFPVDMYNKELLKSIDDHINAQTSDIQRIFRLRFYADMTFSQIAKIMDMSEATVKTKHYRSLKQIKEAFPDEY